MDMYLQCGWGMMGLCRELIEFWNGGTAVLSPRDQTDDQLIKLASEINTLSGGSVLLDPQFYLPHSAHERLCAHEYWPASYNTGIFWNGPQLDELLLRLSALNAKLNSDGFILPGLLATAVDSDWLYTQKTVVDHARQLKQKRALISTIALTAEVLQDDEQVIALLEGSVDWNADAYYVVCQHPNGDYLVKNPNWLANLLDITAGLKLRSAGVIVGYANHQLLALGCSKVDVICSGTWMNVRSFPPEKFDTAAEEIKQKTTWYYCPKALSEYKITFLDIARKQRMLPMMAPSTDMGKFAASLFSGVQPTSSGFSESDAFRHYLNCLKIQTEAAVQSTFDATLAVHEQSLNEAETLLSQLNQAGIAGQQRVFREIVDVNRGAIALHKATRGPMLGRRWASL